MSSSTIQFVVAGALIAAWAWMLGRPILTSLFRRSRRDSIGHFRYQQAVLSSSHDGGAVPRRWWTDRPRPIADWRDQPKERRRLQTMLGFAMATFASMLLAIALRGPLIRLFVLIGVCFLAYLCLAAVVGSMELRAAEAVRRQRAATAAGASMVVTSVGATERAAVADSSAALAGSGGSTKATSAVPTGASGPARDELSAPIPAHEVGGIVEADEHDLDEFESFGTGIFDDGFYEPIPELAVQPLTLDSSLFRPDDETVDAADHGADPADGGHSGHEPMTDETPALDEQPVSDEPPASDEQPAPDEAERNEPTFTTPPAARVRPRRDKARPIYIEAQLDDEGRPIKAVND